MTHNSSFGMGVRLDPVGSCNPDDPWLLQVYGTRDDSGQSWGYVAKLVGLPRSTTIRRRPRSTSNSTSGSPAPALTGSC